MAQATRLRRPPVDMPDVDLRRSGFHRWVTGSLDGATALAGPSAFHAACLLLAGALLAGPGASLLVAMAVVALALTVLLVGLCRRWGSPEAGWLARFLFGPGKGRRPLPGALPLVALLVAAKLSSPLAVVGPKGPLAVGLFVLGGAAALVGPWVASRAGWQP